MTFTDSQVRMAVADKIALTSYRAVGLELDIDFSYLNAVVKGRSPLTAKIAAIAGYEPVPAVRNWRKKEAAK